MNEEQEARILSWLENHSDELFNHSERLSKLEKRIKVDITSGFGIDFSFIQKIYVQLKNRYLDNYPEKEDTWAYIKFDELVGLYLEERKELDEELKKLPIDKDRIQSEILDSILFLIFMYSWPEHKTNLEGTLNG